MAAPHRPHPADPEFDSTPGSTVRLRDFRPADHQRLVVNPMLGVLGLVVSWQITLRLLASRFPPVAVLMIVVLVFLPSLIHFHCLDCGQTGRYSRREGHACASVAARWHQTPPVEVRFPSSHAQLTVWGWAIGSVSLLVAVLGGG